MKFGQVRLDHAEGAVLVHSLRTNDRTFRKGRVLEANDVAHLSEAGFEEVTAAHLEMAIYPKTKPRIASQPQHLMTAPPHSARPGLDA